jgi:hypothetical protein
MSDRVRIETLPSGKRRYYLLEPATVKDEPGSEDARDVDLPAGASISGRQAYAAGLLDGEEAAMYAPGVPGA